MMKIIVRLLVVAPIVLVTYLLFSMTIMLFPLVDNYWAMMGVSVISSLAAGLLAWKRFGTEEHSVIANVILGALIIAGAGVIFGVFGTMLIYPDSEQAIFGLFYALPGLVIGAILGLVVPKRHTRTLDGLLWLCAVASLILVVVTVVHGERDRATNSTHIREPSDIERRDSSLDYLYVRSLPDEELTKLARFENLWAIDFERGYAHEAQITDDGLKTLMEMDLPKLTQINLGHCSKITDEGMTYIAAMPRLERIFLAACQQITDEGLALLAASTSIELIDLRDCRSITDDGLRYLATMPRLETVMLGGDTSITMQGIEMLQQLRPDLSIQP